MSDTIIANKFDREREYLLGNATRTGQSTSAIALVPLHSERYDQLAPSVSTDTTVTSFLLRDANIRHTPLNVNVGAHITQQIYALTHPSLSSAKTIGHCGSFALIFNNLVGPAMLGFPNLFQQAGVLPVVLMILLVYFCSSLCGTLLADALSCIPSNSSFKRDIDFSTAFHIIVGGDWYVLTQSLFLLSCFVQATAAIVESAQSIDGFLASFLIGRTYGLQLYPEIMIVTWSPEFCRLELEGEVESALEDCTPFHNCGPVILTAGYLIATAIFLPLGRGRLKETVGVQIFSFIIFCLLILVFVWEFTVLRGLNNPVPLIGNNFSQLAGVVLFNFAYTITLPSWLTEKKPEVSVNSILWSATTASSVVYVLFGWLGAAAFERAGPNLLVLLASSKVHMLTRICSALFGIVIIGCGTPVFCVIIKNVLEHTTFCSPHWAFFSGSVLPFLLAWLLYQGSLLMQILNWTGLLVNGSVAFLLPLVLAYKAIEVTAFVHKNSSKTQHDDVEVAEATEGPGESGSLNKSYHSVLENVRNPCPTTLTDEQDVLVGDNEKERELFTGSVRPFPECVAKSPEIYQRWVLALIGVYIVIFVVTIVIDTLDNIVPDNVEYIKRF